MLKFAVDRGFIEGSARRMPARHLRPAFVLFIWMCACIQSSHRYVNASLDQSVDANSNNNNNKLQTNVIELNEENWRLMLNGEWMIEFYAPWCPACKNLSPTWERFASACNEIDINVAKVDVTTSTSLSGRFFVTALPTIYHVKDNEFRQYRGSRDFDALMFFIKQKQWNKLEPIPSWKKPDTIHMSILSYVFKLSHTLKDFNAQLQEEYGLPTWAAYAFFAIGTIFIGAALGLILVCVLDFVYPPKRTYRQSFSETKNKQQEHGVEDLANDEIEDDDEEDEAEEEIEDEDEDNEVIQKGQHDIIVADNNAEDENNAEEEEEDEEDEEDDNDTEEAEEEQDEDDKAEAEGEYNSENTVGEKQQKQKQRDYEKTSTYESSKQSENDQTPATATITTIKADDMSGQFQTLNKDNGNKTASASPGEVRKRKPRKAD